MRFRPFCLRWLALGGVLLAASAVVYAQGVVRSLTITPFVVGFIPVVSGGAVGGVSIDARGVVDRADVDQLGALRAAREKAFQPAAGDLSRASGLRKVSLRRLEAAIIALREKDRPLGLDILNLAGLQRIRYVFVDVAGKDIILAGPADAWKIGEQGDFVGRTTGDPVLRLEDLIVALRTAEAAGKEPISCSIDPSPEGVRKFRFAMRGAGSRISEKTLRRLEKAVGPQQVTITGVAADTHFARVMLAADVLMKRIAMDLEEAPIEGLPSYLDLVKDSPGRLPADTMPRWWLAPDYEPLLRDAEGLAWELRGAGVKVMTEDTRFSAAGRAAGGGKAHPLARQWAETFTKKYDELAEHLPVFVQLRNCMDLAIVAALLVKEDLPTAADYKLPLLMNAKVMKHGGMPIPKTIASQASLVKLGRGGLVSVSGGVGINSWRIADQSQEDAKLADVREKAVQGVVKRWWWD